MLERAGIDEPTVLLQPLDDILVSILLTENQNNAYGVHCASICRYLISLQVFFKLFISEILNSAEGIVQQTVLLAY